MKLFFCGLAILFPILVTAQPASIITRVGVATTPIKYYFSLSSALSSGVNHSVKITVSASNAEKTAIHFNSVQLFDTSGAPIGANVASKTDALTGTPYGFVFQNFRVAPLDLVNVAGVEITFLDVGGENSTGKVTIHGVAVSVIRDSGEACVIADPITIVVPPPPIPTIKSIQAARPLVQPGTHGTGGGGSCGPTTDTYSTAGSFTWTAPTGVITVQAQVWGAGGGGASASGEIGAGGGAYSIKNNINVSPGTGYTVLVGAGGAAGADGADSYFLDTLTVLAKGGGRGGIGFGQGGQWAGGVGDTKYSGGTGGGTGGGSSAGTSSNGMDGMGSAGGAAPPGGGNGGTGAAGANDNGSAGSAPGGGGGSGGSGMGTVGGAGGAGKVVLTYTASGCGASVYDSFMDLIRILFRFKK